jgi:DNA-binding HxlR family transcriptional regulator
METTKFLDPETIRAHSPSTCPNHMSEADILQFEQALVMIGKKWSLLVTIQIALQKHRFCDIKNQIPGISDRVLSDRLKELESDGIIEKRMISLTPIHCEYHLTQKGEELRVVFNNLITWGLKWGECTNKEHQKG